MASLTCGPGAASGWNCTENAGKSRTPSTDVVNFFIIDTVGAVWKCLTVNGKAMVRLVKSARPVTISEPHG